MKQIDLAWAAGFIDGEGSIHKHKANSGPKTYVRLAVHQVRREPLDRLATIIGGNVRGPYPTAAKPRYQLQLTSAPAERAIKLLWPYFSNPTKEKYERAKEPYGR